MLTYEASAAKTLVTKMSRYCIITAGEVPWPSPCSLSTRRRALRQGANSGLQNPGAGLVYRRA